MALVNINLVAQFFGVTPQRVTQLVKEGMPRRARGQYEITECARWYIKFLQAAVKARSGEGPDGNIANLTAERTRQVRAANDRQELLTAEQRGELIDWREVKVLHDGFMALLVQGTEAAPQRITSDPEMQRKIAGEMNSMRHAWADWWQTQAAEVQQASIAHAKRRK